MFLFAFVLSFVLAYILMTFFIPALRKFHIGQYIRKEGPREHNSKKGTPIFGGLIIYIASLVSFIVCNVYYKCFEFKYLMD